MNGFLPPATRSGMNERFLAARHAQWQERNGFWRKVPATRSGKQTPPRTVAE
jgi:hypothetical protein